MHNIIVIKSTSGILVVALHVILDDLVFQEVLQIGTHVLLLLYVAQTSLQFIILLREVLNLQQEILFQLENRLLNLFDLLLIWSNCLYVASLFLNSVHNIF